MEIWRKASDPDHPYRGLLDIRPLSPRIDEEEHYTEMLKIFEKELGNNHLCVGIVLEDFARFYRKRDRFD